MANYTRYSPADWSTSNMSHYNRYVPFYVFNLEYTLRIYFPFLYNVTYYIIYIIFCSADNARNNSERVRNEAVRLMRDREDKTVLTQRDADRRIGERLHDVTFWRSELQVIFGYI